MSSAPLNTQALTQLFGDARTFSYFTDQPVDDATLHALYEHLKFGPTSANSCPARFVFVRSPQAKEALRPALDAGNLTKTMAAPVTVIVAHDLAFYEKLPTLFPHANARSWYDGKPEKAAFDAQRNGTLQGAYLIMAARALGLDCGPMGGFDNSLVDAAFFAGTQIKSNFLINLGYGDATRLHPRNPRLDFATTCQIV